MAVGQFSHNTPSCTVIKCQQTPTRTIGTPGSSISNSKNGFWKSSLRAEVSVRSALPSPAQLNFNYSIRLSTSNRSFLFFLPSDIDECLEQNINCGPNQMCFNMRGSYQCIDTPCPPNYQREPLSGYVWFSAPSHPPQAQILNLYPSDSFCSFSVICHLPLIGVFWLQRPNLPSVSKHLKYSFSHENNATVHVSFVIFNLLYLAVLEKNM